MSSNPALTLPTLKNVCAPAQTPFTSQSQTGSFPATSSFHQRREGGAGGFGAAFTQRSASSTARNKQAFRKQHKGQRRPRLADEDANAESAAMQSTNSRKGRTSITHLMNFALPPRPQHIQQHHVGQNTRRYPTWGLGSGYHAADKARYIHANYRFIVSPTGDYRAQSIDADFHLDWSSVLQILVSAHSQSTNCPICLSTPVVPRMAKCGHLFCLSCLIRFMHSTDDTNPAPEKRARWKKCPICWDSVYISETRPVRWFTGQEGERLQEGADVVLRLIMRQPGSTLALPRDGAETLENDEDVPWYFAAEVMDYARVMKGSEDYMLEQYEAEIEELQRLEKEDELMFGEDTQWTKKAVASVNDAMVKIKGIGNPPSAPKQPNERKARRPPIDFRGDREIAPDFYDVQSAAKSGQSTSSSPFPAPWQRSESLQERPAPTISQERDRLDAPATDRQSFRSQSSKPLAGPQSLTRLTQNESPFFFYEALLHYYLSPLDIRILKAAFGDYASFPSTILPRVEHVSTGHIVDDELRRRAKYLGHLPQGCEVAFLECNWTDVVAPRILQTFASEIDRRRKKNREKEAREEKERVRAEKEEDNKGWAAARRKRPMLTDNVVSEADFQPLPEVQALDSGMASTSPPWSSSRSGGSWFASLASPSTSPADGKTVWGTRIVTPASPEIYPETRGPEMSENDGWLQDWEQDLLREEDLVSQIEEISMEPGSSNQGAMAVTTGRKKKGKKITLMTTNARRGA